jgi:hypothetical protein
VSTRVRGSRWLGLAALLGLVVVGALLVRPSGLGFDGLPGRAGDDALEVVPEDGDPQGQASERPPAGVAVLHALSTARLGARVPAVEIPLEGRRLRSAVSSRGRQLLAVGLEDPIAGEATIQVRHASGLGVIAELAAVPGPLENLGVSEDGQAVVWAQPPAGGVGWRVHRGALDGSIETFELPIGFEIRDVHGVRQARVAVLGRDEASDAGVLRALVFQVGTGTVVDVEVDVGEVAPEGMASDLTIQPRAAHVWDDRLLLLHIAHAAEDALTTVELRTGEVIAAEPHLDRREAGVVRREARLFPDTGAVAVTGTLTRPDPDPQREGLWTVPLEPLILGAGFDEGARAEAFRRGDASGAAAPGQVLAAGPSLAVVATPSFRPQAGQAITELTAVDLELAPVWSQTIDGVVTAVEINYRQTHLIVVRETFEGVVVSELPLGQGDAVHRSFREGAIVHPTAVVVIELR